MKKFYIMPLIILLNFSLQAQVSGIGVGTTNPQQKLHLASPTGTIRVDGLNSPNSPFNGGGVDKTYPLYVNSNGDLTIETSAYNNSNGSDALSTASINGTLTITAAQVPNDGYEVVEITSFPLTVARNTVLEVKYSISVEVFENSALTIIKDAQARNITNFFTIDTPTLTATTRRYAPSSKCYFNRNDAASNPAAAPDAATGYIYNSGTTYIPLTTGSHTLRFYGTACSGSANQPTFIRFAGGPDAIFLRLY